MDPGEHPVHPAVAQHIHVIDGVCSGDHPGARAGDLQVRVDTTGGLQSQRGRGEVGQAGPLLQRRCRGPARTPHETGIWKVPKVAGFGRVASRVLGRSVREVHV